MAVFLLFKKTQLLWGDLFLNKNIWALQILPLYQTYPTVSR